MRQRRLVTTVVTVLALLAVSSCKVKTSSTSDGTGGSGKGRSGCTSVTVASSPEKVTLLTGLAASFNSSKVAKDADGCIDVRVAKKSSGDAAQVLSDGWQDETANGPRPVIWSPSASSWGGVVNQRLSVKGQPAIAPTDFHSFMLTPLTIAMPRPMAEVLGYPQTPIGFADLIKLARDPQGWGGKGHPEWGPFKLGKTNPNLSTSALSATIATYYAATGKSRDLTPEDLDKPDVEAFARAVESAVVHYGDTTLTFLNNWYRNDARGTSLTYVSAVAVEEKSVLDYNRGDPDGSAGPDQKLRPPRIPLVAIYPKDGTLFSDNPFFILNAPWVNAAQKRAAALFETYVQRPENQLKVLRFGFRPGNPQVALGDPIIASNGVDPSQPQTTLTVPSPAVLVKLIDKWGQTRKGAKVLMVIDVSGSMGEPAGKSGDTKLDLAKQAAIHALRQYNDSDQVGLRIFSSGIGPPDHPDYADLVPIGPIVAQREVLAKKIGDLIPTSGTPLYSVAKVSYEQLQATFDAARINAVLLLTDGKDDHPDGINNLLTVLRAANEGQATSQVRLFTIAYGSDADLGVLKRMAEATNAAAYDAHDPTTIDKVFTAVVSNF